MKPWVHYVPVARDLSDLVETIDWLRAHESEAREISFNAVTFAQHHFQLPTILETFKQTMQEYHDKYNEDILEKESSEKKDL